ncbi:MAG: hypothetical protein K0S86_2646, partial [Geminicoccaceae bacterium]|nr:hypothetical protein [Geminicoccaceae bacterium]
MSLRELLPYGFYAAYRTNAATARITSNAAMGTPMYGVTSRLPTA